jgi:hypothetical protein
VSDPKKHHYVPRLLLRRFADNNGKLWFYNKKAPDIGVCPRRPEDIFFEKHLYSLVDEDGGKNVALEIAFSRFEATINPIFQHICDQAKKGMEPKLSAEERSIVDQYVYLQWKRTPDSLTASMSESDFRDQISEGIAEFEATVRPITDDERSKLLDGRNIKRLFKNIRTKVIAQPGEQVLEAMAGCGLVIGSAAEPKSFVIGSKPIVKFTTQAEKRVGHGEVEVWMPISSSVAIAHVARHGEQIALLTEISLIRAINLAIARQSTAFAGRSERLISSLARNKQ